MDQRNTDSFVGSPTLILDGLSVQPDTPSPGSALLLNSSSDAPDVDESPYQPHSNALCPISPCPISPLGSPITFPVAPPSGMIDENVEGYPESMPVETMGLSLSTDDDEEPLAKAPQRRFAGLSPPDEP